jgi:hypothetical protein
MKALKIIIPALVVLALVACAKPPQADIDAAKASLAAAENNADVVAYAPVTLKAAQDKLAQMNIELKAKRYDKVKTLALETKSLAATAVNDAARNKVKAQADATNLIDALKKALPTAQQKITAAKRVKGIKLDFAALTSQLAAAKVAIADAQKDLSAGSFASALQKATAVQAQMADGERAVSDAVQAATSKKK